MIFVPGACEEGRPLNVKVGVTGGGGGELIIRLRGAEAVWGVGVVLSVTVAVKLKVPAAVGVPAMIPVDEFKLRPLGSVPLLIDHL